MNCIFLYLALSLPLYTIFLALYLNTVGENIIATTKIRNNYGPIQSFIFPILRILQYCRNSGKSDNYMGSNTEKKPYTNLQNSYKNWSKEITSDNFCYRKVERTINKWGEIEKRVTKIISYLNGSNDIFADCISMLIYNYLWFP